MTYEPNVDFFTAEYSGSGDVTEPLQAVDLVLPPGPTASSSTSGCETEDFADFVEGNIALFSAVPATSRSKHTTPSRPGPPA